MLLSQAFAAALPADREGDIVNLNDVHALRPRAEYFAYTQSKAALHDLTRQPGAWPGAALRVNEIALGAVLPPASPPESYGARRPRRAAAAPLPDARRRGRRAAVPAGVPGGDGRQTILVDGGEHLSVN
ncbi:MAG: SDR family NAD(P)-dependent oxidoreductase [bacterium]|nr:SDR family NAD(P)-dependent oxidoreductase [bacterium]